MSNKIEDILDTEVGRIKIGKLIADEINKEMYLTEGESPKSVFCAEAYEVYFGEKPTHRRRYTVVDRKYGGCYKYKIGEIVHVTQCYPTKAGERFEDRRGFGNQTSKLRAYGKISGYVVGYRNVIMETTEYLPSGYKESGYRRGKKEWVLLVSVHPARTPFIVRLSDIIDCKDSQE